jgi:hypothetical protein
MNKQRMAILSVFLFLVLFATTGCGQKEILMDVPATDGNYHYSNKDLGFSIILPAAFQYYQVQRVEKPDYIDIEYFVPTSDTGYFQPVPGYAMPLIVRMIKTQAWQKMEANQGSSTISGLVIPSDTIGAKSDNYVYVLKFWNSYPEDWQQKWNDSMKQDIISSFKKIK